MLRVSALSTGNTELNLHSVTAANEAHSGVPGGDALLAFAEAAVTGGAGLQSARNRLRQELGEAALIEAAAVVGNFERMTRIADGAGIPIDERNLEMTQDVRDLLALDRFVSARLPESPN